MSPRVRIALPKGRLLSKCIEAFRAIGLHVPTEADLATRRLVIENDEVEWIFVKDGDVPVYVEFGAADLGVAGLDQVFEQSPDVFRPVEFPFGRCRMMLLGAPDSPSIDEAGRGRIATKYPNIARRFLDGRGLDWDVVQLQGSVELAAVLRLSPFIVDLVETGETARVHGLRFLEVIADIAPQLIVNKTSYTIEPAVRSIVARMAAKGAATPQTESGVQS